MQHLVLELHSLITSMCVCMCVYVLASMSAVHVPVYTVCVCVCMYGELSVYAYHFNCVGIEHNNDYSS